MKIFNISFSPTGGTAKAAGIIAGGIGDEIISVDLTDPDTNFDSIAVGEADAAVISVPSYGGRVPKTAVERIERLRGSGLKTVIVCVYGNRAYEDTLVELADTVKKAEFKVIAAVAAVAEHSIVRKYAARRPDEADKRQLDEFAEKMKNKLLSNDISEPDIPGNRPYKKAGTSIVPKAGKECVSCGICAEKCPVKAIDRANNKNTDAKKCISCMRCVKICPHSARKINQAVLSAASLALKKVCSDRKECELYI